MGNHIFGVHYSLCIAFCHVHMSAKVMMRRVLSAPPDTMRSASMARQNTAAECVCRGVEARVQHTGAQNAHYTYTSEYKYTSMSTSGCVQATSCTLSHTHTWNVRRGLAGWRRSHRRMDLSPEPLTTLCPSDCTLMTADVWPLPSRPRVTSQSPPRVSHTCHSCQGAAAHTDVQTTRARTGHTNSHRDTHTHIHIQSHNTHAVHQRNSHAQTHVHTHSHTRLPHLDEVVSGCTDDAWPLIVERIHGLGVSRQCVHRDRSVNVPHSHLTAPTAHSNQGTARCPLCHTQGGNNTGKGTGNLNKAAGRRHPALTETHTHLEAVDGIARLAPQRSPGQARLQIPYLQRRHTLTQITLPLSHTHTTTTTDSEPPVREARRRAECRTLTVASHEPDTATSPRRVTQDTHS